MARKYRLSLASCCGFLAWKKALRSKLLKYLDSDTLSYYFGCELTALLQTASFNLRVFFFSNAPVEKLRAISPYFHITPYYTAL